jgi:hypothetical protein
MVICFERQSSREVIMKPIRYFRVITVVLCGLFLALHGTAQPSYYRQGRHGYFRSANGQFSMTIHNVNSRYYDITLKTKAAGWMAIGFGQTMMMKDAEIILVYNDQKNPRVKHEFATGLFGHRPIAELDKQYRQSIVTVQSHKQESGWWSVVVRRPIGVKGKYLKKMKRGVRINFMYAVSGSHNPSRKHHQRGSLYIRLP